MAEAVTQSSSAEPLDLNGDGGVLKRRGRTSADADAQPQQPALGDRVEVHYRGWLVGADGSEAEFDSSWARGRPLAFTVGSDELVKGFSVAVLSMAVNESAEFAFRHDYGYGELGLSGRIPPYAELHFEITLVRILTADEANTTAEAHVLALPAPGDDVAANHQADVRTVVVSGEPVKLDHLGPMVINTDGTVSRITNWHDMSEREQDTTLRVIVKRNKKRRKALEEAGISINVDV